MPLKGQEERGRGLGTEPEVLGESSKLGVRVRCFSHSIRNLDKDGKSQFQQSDIRKGEAAAARDVPQPASGRTTVTFLHSTSSLLSAVTFLLCVS
jgi:hypothetical protein